MSVLADVSVSQKARLFEEAKWVEISDRVARAFRMSEEERARFESSKVAQLIAALPYLAGCEDADRTAVAHLGAYLLSIKETKPYFHARPEDDASPLERLWLGANFKGGDRAIIERGLCLLALNMVSDYKRDLEEDARLGKYNPIASGAWNFEAVVEELQWKVVKVHCEEMDEILPITAAPQTLVGKFAGR